MKIRLPAKRLQLYFPLTAVPDQQRCFTETGMCCFTCFNMCLHHFLTGNVANVFCSWLGCTVLIWGMMRVWLSLIISPNLCLNLPDRPLHLPLHHSNRCCLGYRHPAAEAPSSLLLSVSPTAAATAPALNIQRGKLVMKVVRAEPVCQLIGDVGRIH